VGVSSALAPSTYAWTLSGSSFSSSISIRSPATRLGVADASAGSRAHSSGQLLHRERLHEVVVGADLERVNAVVLGPPCGDDDDGRADALVSSLLDDAPAVDAGQHEIEDADVRPLVAQAGRARSRRFATPTASKPAVSRCRAIPRAMTSSSSMIRTFAIWQHHSVRPRTLQGRTRGYRLVSGW
jgi:hypothetical protein